MQFFGILLLLSICRIFSVTLIVTSFADILLASLLACGKKLKTVNSVPVKYPEFIPFVLTS